jgi:hypothetical protein
LTRKLADRLDGIDLSHSEVGDTVCLNQHDADVIVAEGWAERLDDSPDDQRTDDRRSR